MPIKFFVTGILGLASFNLVAQGNEAKPKAAEDTQTLKEVLVSADGERPINAVNERKSKGTALFGEGDLREIPFTVNVTTSQDIANRQAKTLGEALAGDPAVRNDYGGSGAYPTESFNIRGFNMDGTNSFLKDGLPMANQVTQGTENVEQIEVLRGPIGFRHGFIPPGGAINLVTKKPTESPLRSIKLSSDDLGSVKAHADLGDRVGSDKAVGYRFNAAMEKARLFFEPVERNRRFVSLATDYRLSSTTTLSLSYDLNHFIAGPDIFHYTVPDQDGNEIKNIKPETYFGQKALPDLDFMVQTGSVGIDSKITDNLSLVVQGGYYGTRNLYSMTNPRNAQSNGDFEMSVFIGQYKQMNYSGTAFLSYKGNIFNVEHTISGGLNNFHSRSYSKQGMSGTLGVPGPDGTIVPFINNFFSPKQFDFEAIKPSGPYLKDNDERQDGYFLSDQIRFDKNWILLLAARYSHVQTEGYSTGENYSTNPTLGLSYDVSDAATIYGSYATAVEQGGIAPATAANALKKLGPIDSHQYEFGVKSDLREGALAFDASIFQIRKEAQYLDGTNTFVQKGFQTHNGAEVRLKGQLIDSWTASAGVQYLDAKLAGAEDINGDRPHNVPKVNASAFSEYSFPASGFSVNGTIFHCGEREINMPNIPAKAAAYSRLDLGVRHEAKLPNSQELITRAGVENVTDEEYASVGWYSLYEPGSPRLFTASIEYKFQ